MVCLVSLDDWLASVRQNGAPRVKTLGLVDRYVRVFRAVSSTTRGGRSALGARPGSPLPRPSASASRGSVRPATASAYRLPGNGNA